MASSDEGFSRSNETLQSQVSQYLGPDEEGIFAEKDTITEGFAEFQNSINSQRMDDFQDGATRQNIVMGYDEMKGKIEDIFNEDDIRNVLQKTDENEIHEIIKEKGLMQNGLENGNEDENEDEDDNEDENHDENEDDNKDENEDEDDIKEKDLMQNGLENGNEDENENGDEHENENEDENEDENNDENEDDNKEENGLDNEVDENEERESTSTNESSTFIIKATKVLMKQKVSQVMQATRPREDFNNDQLDSEKNENDNEDHIIAKDDFHENNAERYLKDQLELLDKIDEESYGNSSAKSKETIEVILFSE